MERDLAELVTMPTKNRSAIARSNFLEARVCYGAGEAEMYTI
jgi:hypothetical protein